MLFSAILGMTLVPLVFSMCPCTVDDQTSDVILTCIPNSINNFPEDIAECTFENEKIISIELFEQPLKQLQARAFADFVNLKQLGIAHCHYLNSLSPQVFDGIPELNGLYIEKTNLTFIPEGALDDLTRLYNLYIPFNKIDQPYLSNAWHFCRRLDAINYDLLIEGDLEVGKVLMHSSTTDDYCLWRQMIGEFNPSVSEKCTIDENSTYTCDSSDMEALACELQDTEFNDVIFEFPASPGQVDNFFEAETNEFFEQFNYQPDDHDNLDYAKVMTKQRLFGTKLDLSNILKYTSSQTKEILIHADTVYMSEPVSQPIDFDIMIRSRITSLDYSIPMKYNKEEFFEGFSSNDDRKVERWADKEDHVRMSPDLVVRVRKFGRIEIVDALPENYAKDPIHQCTPGHVNITDYRGDLSTWFDATSINLNYIGARTLLTTNSNNQLLEKMTNFQLNYIYDANVVGEPRAFVAGQQFFTIKQLLQYKDAHNVPVYSLNTIQELADTMHDSLSEYRATEIQTEDEMSIAKARVADMQVQFKIVEAQQQLYIEAEMEILDAIFTSVNESWHWSFEHREDEKKTSDEALQLIMDNIFDMQEEEYKNLLEQAKVAKTHYEATVEKYETQVQRYLDTAESLMKYQMNLMEEMQNDTDRMNEQLEIFEDSVEQWQHKQETKAALGLFKGIFEIEKGIIEGLLCEPCLADAIKTAAQGALDIAGSMNALAEITATVNDIMAALEVLDELPLDEMSLNMTISYKDSLNNAIAMKESAHMFEDIQLLADNTLQDLKVAIPEIEGTADLQVACKKLTMCGFRLIDALSDFADKMLELAERQDELIVAQSDLERATSEVERINAMLEELEATQAQYEENVEASRKAYEDEVAELEQAFDEATAEEKKQFEDQIMALFGNFEDTLNGMQKEYNDNLGELMMSIQMKNFGLKDASMNQRSMVMALFYDACDTMFYSSFHKCDREEMPMMSDDFTVLMEALTQIKWDSLTDTSNFPVPPTNFEDLTIELIDNEAAVDYPIQTLKETGSLAINLWKYDKKQRLDDFWRNRITLISLTLLQADGSFVPSPGVLLGDDIQIRVIYPPYFNNTDGKGDKFKFLAQELHCNADYVIHEEGAYPYQQFTHTCEIDEDFLNGRNYKPSPDGIFSFRLENMEEIDMEKVAKVSIRFSGSNIPKEYGDKLMGAL